NIGEIISLQRNDVFGSWAVQQGAKLSELQEAVVFHFATLGTMPQGNVNYIPKPEEFVNSLNKIGENPDFFVIDLGGVHYHIEKRPEYIFSTPKQLRSKIEEIGQGFGKRIEELKRHLSTIEKLEQLFSTTLQYSEGHLTAYLNKDLIESFERDASLNLTTEQFQEFIKAYNEDNLRTEDLKADRVYREKLKEYEEKLGKRINSDEMMKSKSTIKSQAQIRIRDLEKEIADKESRSDILRNTESAAHETRVILWKTNSQNTLDDKDTLLNQAKSKALKYETESDLNEKLISLAEKLGPLKGQYGNLVSELPVVREMASKKKVDFETHFKKAFNENELAPIY
ncbi:MAG: hypothetical protein C0490_28675, partial [Marivirga sp.]|nr:hypothetical protein [Marivirga sp.]